MSDPIIFTIGYEGRAVDQLIEELHSNQVSEIVDVRETPTSRKKGFSKNQLAHSLEAAGLKYQPARALGTPREIRNRYRKDGNWPSLVDGYLEFLEGRQVELQELLEEVRQERVCLFCYERNSADCHRSLIAGRLKEMSGDQLVIVDL